MSRRRITRSTKPISAILRRGRHVSLTEAVRAAVRHVDDKSRATARRIDALEADGRTLDGLDAIDVYLDELERRHYA